MYLSLVESSHYKATTAAFKILHFFDIEQFASTD